MTWPSQDVLSQLESCSVGHLMVCCSKETLGKPRMLPQHSLTCFLLSCSQLPPLAKKVPCSCHAVHRFCCMRKISTANVTFHKARGAWKYCSSYQRLNTNKPLNMVFVFSSLLTADAANGD